MKVRKIVLYSLCLFFFSFIALGGRTTYRNVRSYLGKFKKYEKYIKQTKWESYKNNPVLGNYETGTLFDPDVFIEDNIFKMYVSARKSNSIVYSESTDGINWSYDLKTCLEPNPTTGWENVINRACVLKVNDKYLMYYTGQQNNISRIGLAESVDGIHFFRVRTDCIIYPEYYYEGSSVMNPQVIYDEKIGLYKMWYSAGETYEPDVICYATSEDGINFKKHKYNPIFIKSNGNWYDWAKVSVGKVLYRENKYEMYYIGYQNVDTAYICRAYSDDGISNWIRDETNPLVMSNISGFATDAVYKPSAVYTDDGIYLYYNGRTKNTEYIGLSINKVVK